MKKLTLFFVGCFVCPLAWSQWTTPNASNNINNTNSGNVGIGNTTPAAPLEVTGTGTLDPISGRIKEIARFSAYTAYNTNYSQLRFLLNRFGEGSDWTSASTRIQCMTDATSQGYIDFNPPGGQFGLAFGSGTNELMRIMPNGRVGLGIGNINPPVALSVLTNYVGDAVEVKYNSSGFVRLHANSLSSGNWNPITAAGDAGLIYGNNAVNNGLNTSFGFVLAPWSNSMSGIHMDLNGNVGIYANDTKGYQLAVNGAAIFTKVVVHTYPFPDYVFDSTYRLAPLASIETYIQTNHHLPEIPSADSVQENGLDIGNNQAVLLKKIEELTLYLINQQKELQKLKRLGRKLQEQEKEIKILKKRDLELERKLNN